MRKWLCLAVVLAILIEIAFARADDIDNQIQLKESQLQSLQWEFRFIQERATTIQGQAQKLQDEINGLKKQKDEGKKKELKPGDKK